MDIVCNHSFRTVNYSELPRKVRDTLSHYLVRDDRKTKNSKYYEAGLLPDSPSMPSLEWNKKGVFNDFFPVKVTLEKPDPDDTSVFIYGLLVEPKIKQIEYTDEISGWVLYFK